MSIFDAKDLDSGGELQRLAEILHRSPKARADALQRGSVRLELAGSPLDAMAAGSRSVGRRGGVFARTSGR